MQLARSNETKTDGHNSEHDFTKSVFALQPFGKYSGRNSELALFLTRHFTAIIIRGFADIHSKFQGWERQKAYSFNEGSQRFVINSSMLIPAFQTVFGFRRSAHLVSANSSLNQQLC